MQVVVTGARGFIGRNLVSGLQRSGVTVASTDVETSDVELREALRGAELIFHLAGVNRPSLEDEFRSGNVGSLERVLDALDGVLAEDTTFKWPGIVLSSSRQAAQDNAYGRSKLAAEEALRAFSNRTGAPAVIYRLPGVFGKWCRPDYNSVVATFCHNLSRGLPITISDPTRIVELVHVDDVVESFASLLGKKLEGVEEGTVAPVFEVSLGDLAARIRTFSDAKRTLEVPDAGDALNARLLGTYLSYVPPDELAYALETRADSRGTLAELLKSPRFGQIFVSRTRPGVTRGNHTHDRKVEKFCVLEGEARIRLRRVDGKDVTEFHVFGGDFVVVDIPPGMTHSIENVGAGEMVVLFWASEILDRERPDTFGCEVLGEEA